MAATASVTSATGSGSPADAAVRRRAPSRACCGVTVWSPRQVDGGEPGQMGLGPRVERHEGVPFFSMSVSPGEQVGAEEGQFGVGDDLVLLQERRVVAAWHPHDGRIGGSGGGADGGRREHRLVLVGDDD